jgi:adenine-specific DNA-methyltransferase
MSKYDDLNREQLIALLTKRDRTKKLGLVWERDEIEADNAVDSNFVAATIIPELSDKAAPWRNMVIEGDNYDALRWLRMTMAGQVKCIYIDPPYNTGSKDWVYNDHYANPEDTYFHSTWLEFLFRRLSLARDLLSEDGVILVSINDDQRAKLELLMDEALPGMRVGSLVWRTRDTTSAKYGNFSDVHEHILIYAKSNFIFNGSEKSSKKYKNPDNDPRGMWNIDPLTLAFDRDDRPNLFYPIYDPTNDIWYPCDPDRVWAYASKSRLKTGQKTRSDTMEEHIQNALIVFPKDQKVVTWNSIEEVHKAIACGEVPVTPRDKKPLIRMDTSPEFWVGKKVGFGRPGYKKFWSELRSHVSPLGSWIARINEDEVDGVVTLRTGSGGTGTNEIQAIFGGKAFPHPKPKDLVKQLIEQTTGDDDIVLDFFAGSATTAHAVMETNCNGGGNRRFIMVSSTEATADDPDKNLCRDVTAERIRRLNRSDDKKFSELSAEFAYLRCRKIEFEDLDHDLAPEDVWAALESLHRLPLTKYQLAAWQEHKADNQTLIFADRVTSQLLEYLREVAQRRENAFVYSWAPGQITSVLGESLDVRSVRAELVGRFRQ